LRLGTWRAAELRQTAAAEAVDDREVESDACNDPLQKSISSFLVNFSKRLTTRLNAKSGHYKTH